MKNGNSSGGIRVVIRALRLDDCEAFLTAVRRSRALHGPWILPRASTQEGFAKYVARCSSDQHHGHLVVHRKTGGLVGVINLNDVIRGNFQNASVGYYAFVPFDGKGLMREGLALVLQRAFGELGLHRVEANIQPENRASIALVRRCGFVREGFSRRLIKVRGRWRDHERWAMLSENFKFKKACNSRAG